MAHLAHLHQQTGRSIARCTPKRHSNATKPPTVAQHRASNPSMSGKGNQRRRRIVERASRMAKDISNINLESTSSRGDARRRIGRVGSRLLFANCRRVVDSAERTISWCLLDARSLSPELGTAGRVAGDRMQECSRRGRSRVAGRPSTPTWVKGRLCPIESGTTTASG